MSELALKRLALTIAMLNGLFVAAGAALVVSVWAEPIQLEDSWGFRGVGTLYASSIASVGWLIASKLPRHPIGWLLSAAGVFASVLAFGEGYALYSLTHPATELPGFTPVLWFASAAWIPMMGLLAYMLLLFPTGTLPSPRWRPLGWTLAVAISLPFAATLLVADTLDGVAKLENPYALDFLRPHQWINEAAPLPLVLCMFGAAAGIVARMRRARGDERAQLKWLGYAGLLLVASLMGFALATTVAPWSADAFEVVNVFATVGIPLATGIAIVKYRLYDIDVIINRTLVYGALTAVLAATYFGLVVALQRLLQPVTRESDVAVAASTLAVAALFGPLRRYIQRFIDRRFYRSRYDAQETLESFATRLRDEVELDHLSSELLGVVFETMRPRHASLWLRPGESR